MQHHWVVPLVAAVANAIICLLVLRGGVRNRALRVFVWLILNTILWNLDIFSLGTAYIATCMALALERTWHAYRRPTSPRQRVQAKFWFLAAVVQTPFVLTNILPLYGVRIYPLGSLGNVFTMGIMGYAIARHRLMDVDYVVRKGVSFMLAATLVLVPGGAGIWALALVLDAQEPGIMVCAALALALIAVILIPASQAALETQV